MFLSSLLLPAIDVFSPIAKWATIAVVGAILLLGVLLFFVKREVFYRYVKISAIALISYLLLLAILFFSFDIAYHYSDAYAEENWLDKQMLVRFVLVPLLILCALVLCGGIAFFVCEKFYPNKKRTVFLISLVACLVALVVSLVCIAIYYDKKIANDGYYNSDSASVKQIALYVSAIAVVSLIVGLSFIDKEKLTFDARSLAYAGICVAMSFALSYIKLWDMPNGGSVTLISLLPLALYSYIFGIKKGVFVGFGYGLLQALQDPWLIHPAQFLLDYPIAFSAIGLAGIFKRLPFSKTLPQVKFVLGTALAGTLRFVASFLSGVFAFEAYAGGENLWVYSLLYNSVIFVDIALVLVAGAFILSSKSFQKAMDNKN